jgi:hypothetical protein
MENCFFYPLNDKGIKEFCFAIGISQVRTDPLSPLTQPPINFMKTLEIQAYFPTTQNKEY